jgi:hypothetical protein
MTDDNSGQNSPESGKESEKEPNKETAKSDESSNGTQTEPSAAPSLREPFPFARLFLTIVFGFIASFAFWLIVVLAVLQFVTITISGHKSEELQHFSRLMGRYIQEVFDYMTLASDTQPFPLGAFPNE